MSQRRTSQYRTPSGGTTTARSADRSPRGTRETTGSGAGRSLPQPPGRDLPPRGPWNPTARQIALLAVGLVVVAAVVVAVVLWANRSDDGGAADTMGADPARVAELEAAEAARNAENVVLVTELAVGAQERLTPMMSELSVVLPLDGTAGSAPTDEQVAQWHELLATLTGETEAVPSGTSEHNIVRNGLLVSLGLLTDSVDTLVLADGVDDSAGAEMRSLASDLRTRAADTWAMAATQLDLINIAQDGGHVHVFLPLSPDDAGDGGLGLSEMGELSAPAGDAGGDSADIGDDHPGHDH